MIGEKIYVPGGESVDGRPTDVLRSIDPRQDVWEEGANLPEALSAYALADFEGKMYLFGGWDGSEDVDAVWVYDPVDDVWVSGASLIDQMIGAEALTLSDRIVLIGGNTNDDKYLKCSPTILHASLKMKSHGNYLRKFQQIQ